MVAQLPKASLEQNKEAEKHIEMAPVLPWLIMAATLLLATTKSSIASRMAKPGCRETCGNLSIPYPFGIGPGCFYELGFDVSCEDNHPFVHKKSTRLEISAISLLGGQVRVNTSIAYKCYKNNSATTNGWASTHTARLFTISSHANKLTAIGCYTLAYLGGYNKHRTGTGCLSMCLDKQSVDPSAQCSGMGCCQTSIAPNLTSLNITFDDGYSNSEVQDFDPCSYAFVAEEDWFKFHASYLEDTKFRDMYKDGVPTVFDWVVGNQSSATASMASKGTPTWKMGAKVIDSPQFNFFFKLPVHSSLVIVYSCLMFADIDECQNLNQYPCYGICNNTIGGYNCSCKSGTYSVDPKKSACIPHTASERAKLIKTFVGISSFAILLLTCIFALLIECQKKRLMKEKERFFQQNGGLMLYEELRSKQVDTVRIFTTEELEQATNNFDSSREVGRGGYGTVYKGILKDNRVVAIKRSKIMNMVQKDDFVQEMIILSQINHRSVVRLLGCCLEVEVPMLVR